MNEPLPLVPAEHIVAEARAWLGTPWMHQHPMRGVGCDCVGFVRGVIAAFRPLPEALRVADYARTPDGLTLLRLCRAHLLEVAPAQIQPGDLCTFAFRDRIPQHLGFAAHYVHGGLSLIHALDQPAGAGRVVEHHFSPAWRRRIVALFRVPA